jgi:hypothetical protein
MCAPAGGEAAPRGAAYVAAAPQAGGIWRTLPDIGYFPPSSTIRLPNGAPCCYSRPTLTEPRDTQLMIHSFFTGHFYFSHSNPKAVE